MPPSRAAARGQGSPRRKHVSKLRQFAALSKKNWLLKKRNPWGLALELLLPLLFMALMGALKTSGSSALTTPAVADSNIYPVPTMAFLVGQSTSTDAQPNILCFDDNMFIRCSCDYDKPAGAAITDDQIDNYFFSGLQYPVEALFSTSHSSKAFIGVCTGIFNAIEAAGATPQACEYAQVAIDMCQRLAQFAGDQFASVQQLCPAIEPAAVITTVAQAQTIINEGIRIAETAGGGGVSVPDPAEVCAPVLIAIVPLSDGLRGDATGLSSAEAAALAYYDSLKDEIGASRIANFTSNEALNAYVKSAGYSKDADTPLIGPAVVFTSGAPDWAYTLRTNTTMEYSDGRNGYRNLKIPVTESVTDTSLRDAYATDSFQGLDINPANQAYYTSGLLTLQRSIDTFILVQSGITAPDLDYSIGNFPSKEYDSDDFWSSVGDLFAVAMVLVLMYPVANVIKSLVLDKELKLKEGMLQMGLSPFIYTLSWVFQFTVIFFILAILLTLIGANSVFENSSPAIVFIFFMLFLLATIAFCFFLAAFFQKARSASTYGSLIFFLTVLPYFSVSGSGSSGGQKLLACILPSTAFAVGFLPFADYEEAGLGITSDTVGSSNKANITMAGVLGMLIFDIILYSFLSWYAGQVVASEWGTSKPWYFLVTKKYWRPAAAARDNSAATDAAMKVDETQAGRRTIEPVAESLKRQIDDKYCVAMRGMTKTYKSPTGEPFNAVDAMDLTMYRGQITALLGHNGAGKTTSMSMLTGMVPVTSGKAVVNGLDVNTQMSKIREDLGVCPQHDILYANLTVREHLRMFAVIKGVARKDVAFEVESMIRSVGLVEKRNEKSSGLSGGQKRKLSVGIAFIGGSKVVFLDEPTSGMDPHSRRFTWDVIRKQKEGRVIVLSTHFMDEADILSDRIAIMASGKLKCCGSSLFLKSLYGVGYNLTVVKTISNTYTEDGSIVSQDEDTIAKLKSASKNIRHLVRDHVPKAEVLSDVGAEISFQLPANASASFKSLLLDIDAKSNELCVSTYGMSVTTLEEVFLRVAHGTEDPEGRAEVSALRQRQASDGNATNIHDSNSMIKMKDEGNIDAGKRLQRQRSDSTMEVNKEPAVKAVRPVPLAPSIRFKQHVGALVSKRAVIFKRDKKLLCFTALAPTLFLLLGLLILFAIPTTDQPLLVLDIGDYNENVTEGTRNPIPAGATCAVGTGATCNSITDITDSIPTAGDVSVVSAATVGDVSDMNDFLLENANGKSTEPNFYGSYVWNSVSTVGASPAVNAVIQTNYTALHAAPLYANILNTALLRQAEPSGSITVSMHPMPKTEYESSINEDANTFPTVLFLMIGFAFIPAAWVGYIVREREQKTKHQQVVSGVSLNAYWASTYLWDMISFIPTPVIAILLLIIFGASSMIGSSESAIACFLLLFFWGPANMGFSYCFSFFFTQHAGAMTSTLFLNWVLGLIAPLATFFMLFFSSSRDAAKVLKWVLRVISPSYCLGDGLLNLGNRVILQFVFNYDEPPKPFDIDIALGNLILMWVATIVYALVVLWLESAFSGTRTITSFINDRRLRHRMNALHDPNAFWDSDLTGHNHTVAKKKSGCLSKLLCCFKKSNRATVEGVPSRPIDGVPLLEEDIDVVHERQRMQAASGTSDVIQIHGLRKVYPASSGLKVAVRNMWLGIPKGQCFGLLGINGAGKTTVISTLCGEQTPTQGHATLAGVDVSKDTEEVYKLLGYCPQFDALFDTMTAREHLQLYARIKGIPADKVKEAVDQKLNEMDLNAYADKLAGGYSGGNKRRLSVACAMLGSPEIVFLDEPSTGVDPVGRRSLWDVISRIVTTNKECALVLTTHSMEECEALCQRIGIMVGGRLQCVGSAQMLKQRFGSGYQLEVTAALPSEVVLTNTTNTLLDSAGLPHGTEILQGDEQVRASLRGPYPDIQGEIIPLGKGALLHSELTSHGHLQARDVAAWALQEHTCNNILAFCVDNFKDAELLEKQGGKLRLSLPPQPNMSLGTVFGLIEENRAHLGIGDYALGQTSLEQIFNTFAARQAEEQAVAPGRGNLNAPLTNTNNTATSVNQSSVGGPGPSLV